MPDYNVEIRVIVREMLAASPVLPLLDTTDFKRAFDNLVNDAVRVLDNADDLERQRYGQQSWVLASAFGQPGRHLLRPLAMLVAQSLIELNYRTAIAAGEASRNVTEKWTDSVLFGKLVRKEAT